MVPRTRIELALPCENMALNHARLPFPPSGLYFYFGGAKIINFKSNSGLAYTKITLG